VKWLESARVCLPGERNQFSLKIIKKDNLYQNREEYKIGKRCEIGKILLHDY